MGNFWCTTANTNVNNWFWDGARCAETVCANVEDAINSPVDIPYQHYRDVLQYAQSKVDYVYAPGLYMSQTNMELKISQAIGYNKKMVIATDQQKTGINSDINTELITQTNTGETGIVKPQISTDAATDAQPQVPPHIAAKNQQHINEKTALIVGGVAAGLLMI